MGTMILKDWGVAGAVALLLATPAYAAPTQGTLGSTSQGQINISASVASKVQISNLSDVTFTTIDPGVAASNAQNVCVFSNTATKGYNIKASGSGTVNYTVLDVTEANEKREVDAYIAAYAKGGQTIGSFPSQTKALTKAFELCPEG